MRESTAPGSPASTGEQPALDHDLTRVHPDGGPAGGDPTVTADATGLAGGVSDRVDTTAEATGVDRVGVTGGFGTTDRSDDTYRAGQAVGDLTLRPYLTRSDGSLYQSRSATGTYPDGDLDGGVGTVTGTPPTMGAGEATGTPQAGPTTVGPVVGSASVPHAVRPVRVGTGPRGPRRARLTVRRIDPWSVMKFSFIVSLVLFVVMIVATSVLYMALDAMGVFESFNSSVADLAGGGFPELTARAVIGTAAALGGINVLLFTALATLGAFVYNVCADLVGGIEVTLAERE